MDFILFTLGVGGILALFIPGLFKELCQDIAHLILYGSSYPRFGGTPGWSKTNKFGKHNPAKSKSTRT